MNVHASWTPSTLHDPEPIVKIVRTTSLSQPSTAPSTPAIGPTLPLLDTFEHFIEGTTNLGYGGAFPNLGLEGFSPLIEEDDVDEHDLLWPPVLQGVGLAGPSILCTGLSQIQPEWGERSQCSSYLEEHVEEILLDNKEENLMDALWPPVFSWADESPRLCFGLTPFQSQLDKWAHWVAHVEELNGPRSVRGDVDEQAAEEVDLEAQNFDMKWNCEQPVLCTGFPPLQSDLGKWAQWSMRFEELNGDRVFDSENEEDGAETLHDNDQYIFVDWPRIWSVDDAKTTHEEPNVVVECATVHDSGSGEDDRDTIHVEDSSLVIEWPLVLSPESVCEAPSLCIGLPPLQPDPGNWAQWAVHCEGFSLDHCFDSCNEDDEADPTQHDDQHVLAVQSVINYEEPHSEVPAPWAGSSAFGSRSAKWAQWLDRFEEDSDEEDESIHSPGDRLDTPKLFSRLSPCSSDPRQLAQRDFRFEAPSWDETLGNDEADHDVEENNPLASKWPQEAHGDHTAETPSIGTGLRSLSSDLGTLAQWVIRFEELYGHKSARVEEDEFDETRIFSGNNESRVEETQILVTCQSGEPKPFSCEGFPLLQVELAEIQLQEVDNKSDFDSDIEEEEAEEEAEVEAVIAP